MALEDTLCKHCAKFEVVKGSKIVKMKDTRHKKGYRNQIVSMDTYKCNAYNATIEADTKYGYCPVGQPSIGKKCG